MTKNWLITGSSSGFGAALARAALRRGDRVLLTARDPAKLAATVTKFPDRALSASVDVSDAGSVAAAVDLAEREFGSLDVFVNNAGFGIIGAVEEVDAAEYRKMFETNVFGLIEATKSALPAMRRSRGCFVNMSSGSGIATRAGFGLYSASKFAVEAVSEALALEVKPFGIRVIIVEPGAFRTDFLGRSMTIAARQMDLYNDTAGSMRNFSATMSGSQPGDPVKAADIILAAVDSDDAPLRLPLGADAHRNIQSKLASVAEDLAAWSDRTTRTSFD